MIKNAVRNAVAQSPTVTNYANALPEAEKTALFAESQALNFKSRK